MIIAINTLGNNRNELVLQLHMEFIFIGYCNPVAFHSASASATAICDGSWNDRLTREDNTEIMGEDIIAHSIVLCHSHNHKTDRNIMKSDRLIFICSGKGVEIPPVQQYSFEFMKRMIDDKRLTKIKCKVM